LRGYFSVTIVIAGMPVLSRVAILIAGISMLSTTFKAPLGWAGHVSTYLLVHFNSVEIRDCPLVEA
jgi:hypothetical protein